MRDPHFFTDVSSSKIVGGVRWITLRTVAMPLEPLDIRLVATENQTLEGLVHRNDGGSQVE